MIVHNFDPIIIDFGMIQIRWYSLAYIFGILIGWWYGRLVLKRKFLDTSQNSYLKNFDDLIGYIIIGIIIGGRLGYIVFYNLDYYINNSSEIFKLWKGGMSFHGGLVGVIFATYIFSKLKKLNFKIYLDTISCVAPIGIFLGRVANFINSELYGAPTDKFWGVIFSKIDDVPRHPSQIYEALSEGLFLFIILNSILLMKKIKHGTLAYLFLIFYGTFRIISEQFRVPDEQIGYVIANLSMGSLLSAVMMVLGIFLIIKDYKK